MRKISVTVGLLLVLGATPVPAHHNMSAIFDFNLRVTQTGVLTGLDWRNPHIYLMVNVEDETGAVESWSFEGPAPSFFRNRDVGRTDFETAIGQEVTVEASRARDGSPSGLIREVRLQNGAMISACPQNC